MLPGYKLFEEKNLKRVMGKSVVTNYLLPCF